MFRFFLGLGIIWNPTTRFDLSQIKHAGVKFGLEIVQMVSQTMQAKAGVFPLPSRAARSPCTLKSGNKQTYYHYGGLRCRLGYAFLCDFTPEGRVQ